MDHAAALSRLRELVNPATSPKLSDDDLEDALRVSQIPDLAGVWPGRPGYQPTYDLDWAAAETCNIRALRTITQSIETVTRVTSEGTTFEVDANPPDWIAAAKYWRAKSKIGQAVGYGNSLNVVGVNQPSEPYGPTSQAASRWI